MRALVVWNYCVLESNEIDKIEADHFYCLFDQKKLFSESNDHFYIESFTKLKTLLLGQSLIENKVSEVMFCCNNLASCKAEDFFKEMGISFRYFHKMEKVS